MVSSKSDFLQKASNYLFSYEKSSHANRCLLLSCHSFGARRKYPTIYENALKAHIDYPNRTLKTPIAHELCTLTFFLYTII